MLTPLSGCGRFSLGTDDLHTGTFLLMFIVFVGGMPQIPCTLDKTQFGGHLGPEKSISRPLSSFTPSPTSLRLFPELDSLPPVSVKVSVLSLMESGIIWRMRFQTYLQMDYIYHMHWPGKACPLRGHHYLERVRYFKMEKGSSATTCIHFSLLPNPRCDLTS